MKVIISQPPTAIKNPNLVIRPAPLVVGPKEIVYTIPTGLYNQYHKLNASMEKVLTKIKHLMKVCESK